MATFQYRDPADGQFKEMAPPVGAPGPTGPAGPAGAVGSQAPVGSIMAYVGTTAPTGWHFCDGTPHGSTALEALLGSANAPDLRERFIVGAGSTYALKATGGAATVTLTAAESGLVSHTHTATDAHVHSVNPPSTASASVTSAHTHPLSGYIFAYTANNGTKTSDSGDNNYQIMTGYKNFTDATSIAHTHAVNIPAVTTGAASATTVTVAAVAAANATAAHENMPPFYALAYVIRTV